MAKIMFRIEGDNVIKTTYMGDEWSGTMWGKDDIVLDKETFIQCYKKWIKGQEAADDQNS